MAEITAQLYTQDGKEKGQLALSETIFGQLWNPDLMHQAIAAFRENMRAGTASVKDRSEVRGGGKKPWRQKGTGRARHGSRRSPIWIGGGITHGPRSEKRYSQKLNKKAKIKALYVALSQKLRDQQILFVDDINLTHSKTKTAHGVITALSTLSGFETLDTKKHNNIFIVWPAYDRERNRSFRNLSNVTFEEARNISAFDIAQHRYVVIVNPEVTLATLESRGDFTEKASQDERVSEPA